MRRTFVAPFIPFWATAQLKRYISTCLRQRHLATCLCERSRLILAVVLWQHVALEISQGLVQECKSYAAQPFVLGIELIGRTSE